MLNPGYDQSYPMTGQGPYQQGGQYGMTMYNPYQDYMPQPTAQPQTPPNPMANQQPKAKQTGSLLGRFIDRVDEVLPGEIPMDGTTVFFPTKDYSRIYAKVWGNDGKLYTFCFIPEEPIIEAQKNAEQTNFEKIFTRLDDIEAKLDGRTAPKTKKEEK